MARAASSFCTGFYRRLKFSRNFRKAATMMDDDAAVPKRPEWIGMNRRASITTLYNARYNVTHPAFILLRYANYRADTRQESDVTTVPRKYRNIRQMIFLVYITSESAGGFFPDVPAAWTEHTRVPYKITTTPTTTTTKMISSMQVQAKEHLPRQGWAPFQTTMMMTTTTTTKMLPPQPKRAA